MTAIFEGPLRSKVSIYDVASGAVEVIHEADGIIEAPNWSKDGKFLLVNFEGDLLRLWFDAPDTLDRIDLGPGGHVCNNDHDFSPDGRSIAFSATSDACDQSQVFVVDEDGGNVKLGTDEAPSYFHGWSANGQALGYVADRGDGNYEVYEIDQSGGDERRLTTAGGYDDGPEYTPDGKWIYFNSNRSGAWHIYRMPLSGGGLRDELVEQVTTDAPEDWFPHFSPDGQLMVCVAFPPETEGHNDRMPGMMLRLATAPGTDPVASDIRTVLTFDGGQGSLNVNSWSPDSTKFAFVQFVPI